jgi:hypothetical protein
VAPREGEAQFWVCETHSEWCSFDRSIASREGHPHHAISVHCRTFASILAEFGVPYYLKVDIEGSDRLCIEALDPSDLPHYCSIEHSLPSLETMTLLRRVGYQKFRLIDQRDFTELHWHPYQGYVVMEALRHKLGKGWGLASFSVKSVRGLSRRAIESVTRLFPRPSSAPVSSAEWRFNHGSSGPFGDDLPGQWRSMDEVAFSWLAYWLGHTPQKPGLGCWHDIHCKRDNT